MAPPRPIGAFFSGSVSRRPKFFEFGQHRQLPPTMGSSSKRTAPSTSKSNKKVKLQQAPPAKLPSPTFEDEDSQEDEGEDAEISAFGEEDDGEGFEDLEAGLEEDGDEDEGEDSEVNEFELEGELEGEDEDDDLIDDDGEDLMAALGDEDEEGSDGDDGSDSDEAPPVAPAPIKKANVRNSRAPAPLKPAELRALAFAELTASPISSILSTQVTSLLNPLTPPLAATSPLHPLLKSLHAHITSLPSQKASTLSGLRKKGIQAPRIEKETKSMAKLEMEWEKPRAEDVRIVGSWAWGGSLKVNGEYFVDMAIALPAVCRFQTKLLINETLTLRFAYDDSLYYNTKIFYTRVSLPKQHTTSLYYQHFYPFL